jgi:hypothetical protein
MIRAALVLLCPFFRLLEEALRWLGKSAASVADISPAKIGDGADHAPPFGIGSIF